MRALALFVLLFPTYLFGGWTLIRHFNQPVSCGFFYDPDRGFIGTCSNNERGQPQIWKTTDGGSSWRQASVPFVVDARMTSIHMQSDLVGYASLWEYDGNHGIWKTINGGLTWYEHTQGNNLGATSVHATPHALIVTTWPQLNRGQVGGFSLNDGGTIVPAFESAFTDESNGIAFVNDSQGVVTPGPQSNTIADRKSNCFFTEDGGRTWQEGGLISESWSIYGKKGTTSFFALPEGNQLDPQTTVVSSQDVGRSWRTLFPFSSAMQFTGDIDGAGRTLYVQTNEQTNSGFFRSDDLGITWKSVGGPSHERDTRFVVTGCNGAVVYGFDIDGNVWKTTDGGDGTLTLTISDLDVSVDTLEFFTSCAKVKQWVPITLHSCLDTISIDMITVENDPTSQFSIDTSTVSSALSGSVLQLPVSYAAGVDGMQQSTIRIRAHAGSTTIDTTIVILIGVTERPTPLAIGIDSLQLSTVCPDVWGTIPMTFGSCDDSITIDTIMIEGDGSGQFTIDTLTSNFLVRTFSTFAIPIRYARGAPGSRAIRVRVRAHASDIQIDTVITVTGTTFRIPDPYSGGDSLHLSTVCTDVRGWVPVTLRSCDDSILIESILIENDVDGHFSVDTIPAGFRVPAGTPLEIPILYRAGVPGQRSGRIRLVVRASDLFIDTVIYLLGSTIKLPEPYVPTINQKHAGDTVHIPIYLDRTTDLFSFSDYEFKMSFHTDLIDAFAFDSVGTLTRNISTYTFSPRSDGVQCRFSLGSPITEARDLAQPLLVILARVYLTSETTTTVTVDSFSVSSGVFTTSLLGCSERSSSFTIEYLCGDSTISAFMRTGTVSLSNIRPNPGTTYVDLDISLPDEGAVRLEMVDLSGAVVRQFDALELSAGTHTMRIPTDELAAGLYSFRMRTPFGNAVQSVIIVR